MEEIKNQECPVCHEKKLNLREEEKEVPHFGKVFLFSMKCDACNYNMSDVESAEFHDPCKITFEVQNEKDLNVKVIKSSTANVKIPQLRMSMEAGPASIGFISNVEGLIQRFEDIVKDQKENSEEDDVRKHAKNLLKKIWKIKCGNEKVKIIIEDPNGNSAIISDKAVVEKLKIK